MSLPRSPLRAAIRVALVLLVPPLLLLAALGPRRQAETLPLPDGTRLEATDWIRRNPGDLFTTESGVLTLVAVSPGGARQTLVERRPVASTMIGELRRSAKLEVVPGHRLLRTPVGVWESVQGAPWTFVGWSVTGADPLQGP